MPGFTSITGEENIMYADNCSFDGTDRGGAMTADGQLWIGRTAGSPSVGLGVLTSPLGTLSIGYSYPNITLDVGTLPYFNSINIQTITSSGTYTPTAGTQWVIVECCGGGGAGGGTATHTNGYSAGGAGGSGEYRRGTYSAMTIGSSVSVTIGAGGTGNSAAAGGNGGNTSFGAFITANGGSGGQTSGTITTSAAYAQGGAGGTGGSGGNFASDGNPGDTGMAFNVLNGGTGGSSYFGGGALSPVLLNPIGAISGNNATGYGSGGSGSAGAVNASAQIGGNGSSGVIVVTEYL